MRTGGTLAVGASAQEEFLATLAGLAPTVRRASVLVHVPKAAGTALNRSAVAAGWPYLSLDGLLAARGECPHCGGPCDSRSRWQPARVGVTAPGVHVSVGHRPVGLGLAAADTLAAGGVDVRVVAVVREPVDRLTSLFRFQWRKALDGGLETLARRVGAGWWRGPALVLTQALVRGVPTRLGRRHRARVLRASALDGLHYAVHRAGRLEIDGARWVRSFARHGGGVSYWMDEVFGTPGHLRELRDAGRIELVRAQDLDRFTRDAFGVPAVRANVTGDGAHPAVVAALESLADELRRTAARDAAFADLIAEAAA